MANNQNNTNQAKNRNKPANEQSPSYEVQSYRSNKVIYSNYNFCFDVLKMYTPETLASMVRDPMVYNQQLRNISLLLYGTNGTVRNTIDYMQALPTLDRVIVLHGKNESKKRRNKELMESTLHTIHDREIMRDALLRDMIEGACYYYFETNKSPKVRSQYLDDYTVDSITELNSIGVNASIISLPADYTKIVGFKNSSYVIAFNLEYFEAIDEADRGRKLLKFPKEIRDAYKAWKTLKNGNWYVIDNSKTIVHKICAKRDEPYGRPLVLAAISDILYSDYFTQTKRNILDDLNNRLVYETFPEGKDKGTSSLTDKQQKLQHDTIKNAISQKNSRGGTTFVSVAAGTKLSSLEINNTDIFDEKNEKNLSDKISMDLGIAGALLNGVGSGTYAAQQQNLELISAQLFVWIEQIEAELNKCIAANIIKDKKNWVEVKYLRMTHANKKEMVKNTQDLYLQGKGSLSLWAAACGISPEVFFALLDQELEEGVEEKYPVHATSFTLSKNNGAGRPTSDNPTENTLKSQANNGNSIPSPSD